LNYPFHLPKKISGVRFIPAGVCTRVTNGPNGICFNEQRIIIAINTNIDKSEEITALFSFCPQAILASRPERNVTGSMSCLYSIFIHKAEHQHNTRGCVLNYSGNKSV
jgi:hypothetical protein